MKLVIVSDTHEQHEQLGQLAEDALIHCGDSGVGVAGSDHAVDRLDDWFGRQAFDLILCVGGNHDFGLEARVGVRGPLFRNAVYLQDQAVRYRGLEFYGSPWVPELAGWVFYLPPEELRERWNRIPAETDVLITHSPPRGVLDRNGRGTSCGCPDLQRPVFEVGPRLHCFGHVHASAGTLDLNGTTFVNACMVHSRYRVARRPHELDL